MPSDNQTHELLKRAHTIAVVGLSDNSSRPSYAVARFLQRNGYKIIPVNPNLSARWFGENPVAHLHDIDQHVDIVCVFRRSEHVPEIVDDAIAIHADCVWTQIGVEDVAAARRAEAAGLDVVMDRCMAIEHSRLNRYAEVLA